jgi:drug/metabolite transporter (DMT)-like permease
MRRPRGEAAGLLLLTPILWGASFPGGKIALRHLPALTFMAWSRVLGLVTILALIPLLRSGGRAAPPWRAAMGPGILLGALMFLGYLLQTEGLARTTATNSGFITGLYIVFTPLMAARVSRQRTPGSAWVACIVGFGGLALLSITDLASIRLHNGDLLVLGGAVVWAGHITAVGHFSPKFPPWMLSLAQMGFAAVFQLVAVVPTGMRLSDSAGLRVWPLLGLTGVLGSGVAFTIQVMAQRRLTPARAVVLLAGESLFSALFAAVWIGERLEPHQWLGAALVLGAMAYSELSARRPPSMQIEPATVE